MSVGSIRETYAIQLEKMKKEAERNLKSARETLKETQSQRESLEKQLDEEKSNVRACRKKILKNIGEISLLLAGFDFEDNTADEAIISCARSLNKIHDLDLQLRSVKGREESAKEDYKSAKKFLENISAAING